MTKKIKIFAAIGLSIFVSSCNSSTFDTTEWMGYLASALVLSSFLFSKMKVLRIINMTGAVAFVTYGVMLDIAYPIIITNASIFLIHLYHLLVSKNSENE